MSGQRGPAELARPVACRTCGRRTWLSSGECAACSYAQIPDLIREPPPPPRLVGVPTGVGWPTGGPHRAAWAASPPAAALGWPSIDDRPASLAVVPRVALAPTIPKPAATDTVAAPSLPPALLKPTLDPAAQHGRPLSWWDDLLIDAGVGLPDPGPGWLRRHSHAVRAVLVVMLVAVMAVIYSGAGLVVAWAVLVIPALFLRIRRHRLGAPRGGSEAAPTVTAGSA